MCRCLLAALLAVSPVYAKVPDDVAPAFLAASVNGQDVKVVATLWQRDGQWQAEREQWEALGIVLADNERTQDILSAQALGVELKIDENAQTVDLVVPVSRLKVQTLGTRLSMPELSLPAPGVLINYSIAGLVQRDRQALSVGHEIRTAGRWGLLTSSGQVNWDSSTHAGRYMRGHTRWQQDDYQRQITTQIGDVRSAGQSQAMLGGVRVAKDPGALDPYTSIYPMPTLGGVALDTSTVEILANQARVAEHDVRKGPFTIERFPLRNGRNALDVVVRDAFGREQIVSSKQLYFTPHLLRKGLTTWAVAAGRVRQGITDDYGKLGASIEAAHGLSDTWTLTASAQSDGNNHNAVLGARTVLGTAGVLQVQAGQSQGAEGTGTYRRLQYNYAGPNVGIGVAHERADRYWQLSSNDTLALQARSRTEASLTWSSDDRRWRGRLAAVDLETAFDHQVSRVRYATAEAGWHSGRHTLSASAMYDFKRQAPGVVVGYRYQLNNAAIAATVRQAPDITRVGLAANYHTQFDGKPVAVRGEVARINSEPQVRVGGDAMLAKGWARVEVQHASGETLVSGEFIGAVHLGRGGATWLPRVYDGFAVVDISGVEGVPVRANGRTIGKTNKAGRLVVPNLMSHTATPIRIDDRALPVGVQLSTSEVVVAARRQSGARAVFPVLTHEGRAFVLQRAMPIESGAVAKTDREVAVVGFDGALYLEHPKPGQTISVSDGKGSCSATLPTPLPGWQDTLTIECR